MSDLLQTLAEVAIALAGFSGVVIAFGGGIKALPSVRLSLLLTLSGEVVLFSLIPILLLLKFEETPAWTVSGLLYGVAHLLHIARSVVMYNPAETGTKRPLLDKMLMSVGALLSLSLVTFSVVGQTADIQFFYSALLMFVLSVAGSQFFRILMHLQKQRSADDA